MRLEEMKAAHATAIATATATGSSEAGDAVLVTALNRGETMAGLAIDPRHAGPGGAGSSAPVEASRPTRYSDQPVGWRTRLAGMGGTAGILAATAAATLITWEMVQPMVEPPALAVFDVSPPAAPPEPVQEVPEGPRQVEQKEQKPQERVERPEPPQIVIPQPSTPTIVIPPPVEPLRTADPVPETTAPKSLPAPPANRAASNAEATWEAMVMAQLEQHRRYPASARARREQGVAHITFTLNRQGLVLSSSILQSSGSATLDRAALDTLHRAQPLPPIPRDRPDPTTLSAAVEFFLRR